ncbi:dystroglycan-like [Dorcoceras hygrometricum]|uniref:Dystroglycan-like n=1 Tax=Dorcoceras hygrometricum TaxID=472368 RepID=A0A2Z7CD36_9LAMI|nr:dystroglycan-like [Dorcoceras hygrometricum]
MATSFYSNSQLIVFDSILAMDDPGMVSMFQDIKASGLVGFLGCPAVIYEADLVDFFANASVRDGVVISTVAGQLVEISEEWFAESFDLPVDGLSELSEIPKDVIFYARSIVSMSSEPVSLSGKKGQMKMVTAVFCGVRMDWGSVLFSILKKMVTPGSKKAKGFAVQISLLLENIPNLELGESSEFPASKILTEKTVHRYVSLNDKVGAEEAVGAPKPKAASKKRPAFAAVGAPVIKKRRTMSSKANLEIVVVAQEAVPIQMVEPIAVAPAAEDISDQPAGETDGVKAVAADVDATAEKIDEPVAEPSADVETSVGESIEPAVEVPAEETRPSSADDVDFIIKQWFDLPYDDLIARWDAERPVVTASDTDEEEETMDVGAAGGDQQVQFSMEEPEGMEISDELIDADEKMSLDEIIMTIPAELPLPAWEVTMITTSKDIQIPGVDEKTWYLASLQQIPVAAKGKEPLQLKDPIKDDSYFAKEELVLSWEEAESMGVALQRKMYIILKYRALLVRKYLDGWIANFVPGEGDSAVHLKVINMLSALLSFVLEELKQQGVAHRIRWARLCCSTLFEGRLTSHHVIHAHTIFVVSSQRQYDDTLPPVEFFKLLKKKWGDVCLEAVEFCASKRLLPVGSVNFCRALAVTEPDSSFDYQQPTVFALRFSQIFTVYIQYSLFSRLTTEDISSFVAAIASERIVLRNVQIAQTTVSVASIVQLLDEHSFSDSSSDAISMDSTAHDTATTASISLPAAPSPDISEALNQLRASIDEIREQDDGAKHKDTILLHLHDFEKQVTARLDAQDRVLGELRRDSNDQRNLLSLELQSSHKQLGTQIVTTGLDVVDVRRVVRETHQELGDSPRA